MKRALSLTLAAWMLAAALTLSACGKTKNSSDSQANSESTSGTSVPADYSDGTADSASSLSSDQTTTTGSKKLTEEGQQKAKDEMNSIIDGLIGSD